MLEWQAFQLPYLPDRSPTLAAAGWHKLYNHSEAGFSLLPIIRNALPFQSIRRPNKTDGIHDAFFEYRLKARLPEISSKFRLYLKDKIDSPDNLSISGNRLAAIHRRHIASWWQALPQFISRCKFRNLSCNGLRAGKTGQ